MGNHGKKWMFKIHHALVPLSIVASVAIHVLPKTQSLNGIAYQPLAQCIKPCLKLTETMVDSYVLLHTNEHFTFSHVSLELDFQVGSIFLREDLNPYAT